VSMILGMVVTLIAMIVSPDVNYLWKKFIRPILQVP
jgi:hypothetical protein